MAPAGGIVLIAMGDGGPVHARAAPRRFGSAWTYAGRVSRRRADVRATRCSTTSGSGRSTAATALYGVVGSPVGALGVAGHAQRGVSRRRHRRRLPAAARGRRRRLPDVRARDRRVAAPASPSRTRWRCSTRRRGRRRWRGGSARINTLRMARRPLGGRQHRRRRLPAPLRDRGVASARHAARRCSAPADRRARSSIGAASARRARHGARARSPTRAARWPRWLAGAVGPWPPAPG